MTTFQQRNDETNTYYHNSWSGPIEPVLVTRNYLASSPTVNEAYLS